MALLYTKTDQGRTIPVGTGTPASNNLAGVAKDMYVNSTNGDVYNYTTAWVTQRIATAWSSKVAITIGAVTTPPTKATTKQNDYVQYRELGSNEVEARYVYSATSGAGAADGSGNYLFTLPDSFQFDSSIYEFYTDTSVDLTGRYSLFGVSCGTMNSLDTYSSLLLIVPYNATRFRIISMGPNYEKDFIGSGRYPLGNNNIALGLNFKFFKA